MTVGPEGTGEAGDLWKRRPRPAMWNHRGGQGELGDDRCSPSRLLSEDTNGSLGRRLDPGRYQNGRSLTTAAAHSPLARDAAGCAPDPGGDRCCLQDVLAHVPGDG